MDWEAPFASLATALHHASVGNEWGAIAAARDPVPDQRMLNPLQPMEDENNDDANTAAFPKSLPPRRPLISNQENTQPFPMPNNPAKRPDDLAMLGILNSKPLQKFKIPKRKRQDIPPTSLIFDSPQKEVKRSRLDAAANTLYMTPRRTPRDTSRDSMLPARRRVIQVRAT